MKYFSLLFLLIATRCFALTYYIDFVGGSNTATATQAQSKSTPWQRAPLMAGFSGTGYSHAAGDHFIFKGGVTWDHTCFPLDITSGGTNGNSDYYGVDLTWFTGGAFARPIFDNEYMSCTTHRVIGHADYITIDNIEMKRILTSSLTAAPGLISWFPQVGGLVKNCYIHGWKTTALADDAYGGFVVGTSTPPADLVLDNTEIENSENIGIQMSGVCIRDVAIIQNGCKIHDNSSGVLYCLDFNGSYLYNITGDGFDGVYHYNGIYQDPYGWNNTVRNAYIRNSYLHDCYLGANMAYPNIRGGATCVMYNNVLYGNMTSQLAIEIDPLQIGSEGTGNFIGYNNTIYNFSNSSVAFNVVSRATKAGTVTIINNHVINASGITNAVQGTNVTTLVTGTNLSQSSATATGQGYVLGNLYAPTSTSSSTYNAGTDESGTFTSDILSVTRPQASVWDIGAYEFSSGATTGGSSFLGSLALKGSVILH